MDFRGRGYFSFQPSLREKKKYELLQTESGQVMDCKEQKN